MTTEFVINQTDKIVCEAKKTRNGFKHTAEYHKYGSVVASKAVHYLNRTWESFEYESAISSLLVKTGQTDEEKKRILAICSGKSREETASMFKSTAMVAMLGDVFGQTQKEKNDWKARMLKAGLGNQGLEMPEDWDTLSEDEKEGRLNKVIECMKGKE